MFNASVEIGEHCTNMLQQNIFALLFQSGLDAVAEIELLSVKKDN